MDKYINELNQTESLTNEDLLIIYSSGGGETLSTTLNDVKHNFSTAFQQKSLKFINTIVSAWNTITDTSNEYNFYSNIELDNVTENDFCEIVFNQSDALSGLYSPICETYNGGVTIYSKVSNSITIPSIIIHKYI